MILMNLIGVGDFVIGQWVAPDRCVVGNNDESGQADDQHQNVEAGQIQENDSIHNVQIIDN